MADADNDLNKSNQVDNNSDVPQDITKPDDVKNLSEQPKPDPVVSNQVKKGVPIWLVILLVVLLLATAGFAYYLYSSKKDKGSSLTIEPAATSELASESADAEEISPTSSEDGSTSTEPKCASGLSLFADEDVGFTFCYPASWGTASVMDAKIDSTDTGFREAVRFSANTEFIVGGVSEDWSTTVGRDVGCQEPTNTVPPLSDYDINWHDISGSGMDVAYARRSLPASVGGYSMVETVSNLLWDGVCVQGHKVIDGSRYRVVSAAYDTQFSAGAGITTPRAHMDNPNVLFSEAKRTQFDSLLASISKYPL